MFQVTKLRLRKLMWLDEVGYYGLNVSFNSLPSKDRSS